jgi:hypothetical protein
MPGVKLQDIDQATGMVIAGPYAGYKFDEVQEFLETRAAAAPPLSEEAAPPPAEDKPGKKPATPPKPKTPEEELQDRSNGRVEGLSQAVLAQNTRLESDDEDVFSGTVTDYDKEFGTTKKTIRVLVADMKKSMAPAQRIQRGIHRQLYMLVKQQDPEVQKRIFEQPPVAPPAEGEEETPPPAPPVEEKPAAPKQPKAAPGSSAPPTPPGRPANDSKTPKPKLKGNEKTERAARAFGMTHDSYLLRLEEQGESQVSLDAMTINRKAAGTPGGRRTTVFDR